MKINKFSLRNTYYGNVGFEIINLKNLVREEQ